MAWRWQLLDRDGNPWQAAAGTEVQQFPSQSDAETWLGETWRDLRQHGVASVMLFEEGREVYGPMSLDPA